MCIKIVNSDHIHTYNVHNGDHHWFINHFQTCFAQWIVELQNVDIFSHVELNILKEVKVPHINGKK